MKDKDSCRIAGGPLMPELKEDACVYSGAHVAEIPDT